MSYYMYCGTSMRKCKTSRYFYIFKGLSFLGFGAELALLLSVSALVPASPRLFLTDMAPEAFRPPPSTKLIAVSLD